ncbi:LIM domain-containing protein isoform X3 [Alosa sapidissima]|uniref:LIM domain-containing protein isoform X3 n=1 Tax=Alosa sapidissima TaxID=34773 RepID=UPI001C095587|nr:LIM domain-containing protein isoform X3 [Alosa sapidissima]
MEVKSILRRTQSLRSVHTERTLSVTEVGLRDRKKSVSELVAEYRFTSKGKAPISEHEKQENTPAFVPPVLAPAPVPEPTVDPEVESPVAKVRNSIVRERSRSLSERQPQPLSRAKSMESLPRGTGAPGGTSALKALFESKVMTPRELKHGGKSPLNSPRVSRDAQVKAEAEEVAEKVNEVKKNNSHDPPPLMSQAEEATPKVVRRSRPERRQTVSGVYLDRTSQTSDDKEKRRSLADFGWEKSSISVKAISALFQSKAAAVETSGNQGMDSFSPSGKRPKGIKFQPAAQDLCTVCLKPVYPMERTVTDKFIFHKNCFCCKHCKKKLSIGNYAPLSGEFYCVFHYQQLFRRKGNYDEGFGRPQHKDRWLQHTVNGTDDI